MKQILIYSCTFLLFLFSCSKEKLSDQLEPSINQETIVESYVYKGERYDLIFSLEDTSGTPLNHEVADRLESAFQGTIPIKLRFTDEMNTTYLFDTREERQSFKMKESKLKRDKVIASLSEEELAALISTNDNQPDGPSEWLKFYKDCGSNSSPSGEVLFAPDHLSNFEEKFNLGGVCSAKWEQADLADVSCSSCGSGNWDQSISFITWNMGLLPRKYHDFHNGVYTLTLFRHADFSNNHPCDTEEIVIGLNPGDIPGTCCLNKRRWGKWWINFCDDMNDKITGWRFVYCHDKNPNVMCDGGCYSTS